MQNQPIYIDEYDYSLPDKKIAKYPLAQRDASKLLIYRNGVISESRFSNIAEFLPENALLVYNNTRVIQARLIFQKTTGAHVEVFCLEPISPEILKADSRTSLVSQRINGLTCSSWPIVVGKVGKCFARIS